LRVRTMESRNDWTAACVGRPEDCVKGLEGESEDGCFEGGVAKL
jgi:hypothetical protein